MRVLVVFVLALGAAWVSAGLVLAEHRQFGNVIYPTVPGWSDPGSGDGYVTMWSELPDDRCDFCQIMIGPGGKADGDLTDWLVRNRFTFADPDDRDGFEVIQAAEPSSLDGRDAAVMAIGDGSNIHFLTAVRAGTDFVLTGFRLNAGDDAETAADLEVLSTTFVPWLSQLRFRSEGAASLLGEPSPGGMSGLWWGSRTDTVLGMDMMMQMQTSFRQIMFWPDGTFFEGTPPQGTALPDRAALDKALLTEWGNYTEQGDTILLQFADGHNEELEGDGGSWTGWGYNMYQVQPLEDGTRLDGSISWMYFSGFSPGSGVSGGVSSSGETVFSPDGSYTGSSSGGAFGSFETGGYAFSNGREDGGRYEVRDGLVIFTPNDGETRRAVSAFRAGDDIVIGDDFLDGTAH